MQIFEKTRNAYPNLLASATGRAVAFFSFYFIDGVLIGFMGIFLAMRMRARNVAVDDIALFVAAVYLPASWKWLFGPLVDLCYIERLGRRRGWILGTEALMIVALLAAMRIDFARQFTLFTIVMHVGESVRRFATDRRQCLGLQRPDRAGTRNRQRHDVCRRLPGADRRRLRRDLALRLSCRSRICSWSWLAAYWRSCSLWLCRCAKRSDRLEPFARNGVWPPSPPKCAATRSRPSMPSARSRAALVGLVFVLLPAGAWAMSLSLGTNLMVEFGMSKREQSLLTFVSILVAAVASFVGGLLADRFGRRKTLALYIVGSALPALWMAYVMYQHGWIMPIDQSGTAQPDRAASADRELLGRCAAHQCVSGLAVYHAVGSLHGYLHAGGGRHAVHRLCGDGQSHHRIHVGLAGLVPGQTGLPVDLGHRRPVGHGQSAAIVVDDPPAHEPVRGRCCCRRRKPIMLRLFVMLCVAGFAGACFAEDAVEKLPQPHYRPQESDPGWLKNAAQFHGHLGPMMVFGRGWEWRPAGRRCKRLLRRGNQMRRADGETAGILLSRRPASQHRRHDGKTKSGVGRC